MNRTVFFILAILFFTDALSAYANPQVYAPYDAATGCVGSQCTVSKSADGSIAVASLPASYASNAPSKLNPLPAQSFAPGGMRPIAPGLFIDTGTNKLFWNDRGHYRQIVMGGNGSPVGLAGGVLTQEFASAWNANQPAIRAALGQLGPTTPPTTTTHPTQPTPGPTPPPPPSIQINPANLKVVNGKDGQPLFGGKLFSDPSWMYWSPSTKPQDARFYRYGGITKGLELCTSSTSCVGASSAAGDALMKFYEGHYGAGITNAPPIVRQFVADWKKRNPAPVEDAPVAEGPTTASQTTPPPSAASPENCALFIGGTDNEYDTSALTVAQDGSRDMGREISLPALGLKEKGYKVAILADWGPKSDAKAFLAKKGIPIEGFGDKPEDAVKRKLAEMGSCKNIEIIVNAHGGQCACDNDGKMTDVLWSGPNAERQSDTGKCDTGHYFAVGPHKRFDSQALIKQVAVLETTKNVNLVMASCHSGRLKAFADQLKNACVVFLSSGNSTGRLCGEHDPDYDPDYSSTGEAVMFRYYAHMLDKLKAEPYVSTVGPKVDQYGPLTVGRCFEKVTNNLAAAQAECRKRFPTGDNCKWDSISNSYWMGHFLDRTPTEVSLSSFGTTGYFAGDNFGRKFSDHQKALDSVAKKRRALQNVEFNGSLLSGDTFAKLKDEAYAVGAGALYEKLVKSLVAYNTWVAKDAKTPGAETQALIRAESRKVIELERELVREIYAKNPRYFVKKDPDPCNRPLAEAPKVVPPTPPPGNGNPPPATGIPPGTPPLLANLEPVKNLPSELKTVLEQPSIKAALVEAHETGAQLAAKLAPALAPMAKAFGFDKGQKLQVLRNAESKRAISNDDTIVVKISDPNVEGKHNYAVIKTTSGEVVHTTTQPPVAFVHDGKSGFFAPAKIPVKDAPAFLGQSPCKYQNKGATGDLYECTMPGGTKVEVTHSTSGVKIEKPAPKPDPSAAACNTAKSPEALALKKKFADVADKTIKRQNGGLIDGSRVIHNRGQLLALAQRGHTMRQADGSIFKFVQLNPAENGYEFAYKVSLFGGAEETWYVSEQPHYRDQYPDGQPFGRATFTFWKKESPFTGLTQVDVPSARAFTNPEKDVLARYSKSLSDLLHRAKQTRISEDEDLGGIKTYDLPKNEEIGYVAVIDGAAVRPEPDPVIAGDLDSLKHFPSLMGDLGYRFVNADPECNKVFVPTPTKGVDQILREQIDKLRKKGIKSVYLNLSGHGNEEGVHFNFVKDFGSSVLDPKALVKLFKDYPDMKFTVNTLACHGGGFGEEMEKEKFEDSEPGRCTVFTQSKGYGVNQEGRLQGVAGMKVKSGNFAGQYAPAAFASYYEVFLHKYLNAGKSYGEAHWLADREAKKLVPSDAEVWRSGRERGSSTRESKK